MTGREKAEQHRDMTEMELVETERLLEIMISSDMATVHEVEDMERAVEDLKAELAKAEDEVRISITEQTFKNALTSDLQKTIRAKYGYSWVKEAASRVLAQRAEMACERRVS